MKIQLLFALLLIAAALLSCNDSHDHAGPAKVTSITLNETLESLAPEGTFQLSVTEVLPANAADKTVTWSSVPTSVATVDQTGLVTVLPTAPDGETATITATANGGSGVTATCAITVAHVKVTSITLNQTTASLAPGETLQLSTTSVLPNNATNKNVTWSSIPTTVATVDQTGLVTVLPTAPDGEIATITATANDGSGVTATCAITVAYHVTSITLDRTAISLVAGGSRPLTVLTVSPGNAANRNVTWSSSPSSVATVNSSTGVVTSAAGATVGQTATITATAADGGGATASCTVTIAAVPTNGVLINGLVWATCNVDAVGTFAAAPEAMGMFYQWNRNVAWATTGTVTGWNSFEDTGDFWTAANDPCPAGWRVPTHAEQTTLFVSSMVDKVWTSMNSVNGYTFTDITSGISIFFPAVGYRYITDGNLNKAGEYGRYWSSSVNPQNSIVWYLQFTATGAHQLSNTIRSYGFPVRCVRQ